MRARHRPTRDDPNEPVPGQWYGPIRFDGWDAWYPHIAQVTKIINNREVWFCTTREAILGYVRKAKQGSRDPE